MSAPASSSSLLLPPLLALPSEILDHILSFTLPSGSRAQRIALNTLLSVHPVLTALVRRRIYRKLSCIVGDRKGRDRRVLGLLDGRGPKGEEEGREGYGHLVRELKIRNPKPDTSDSSSPPPSDPLGDTPTIPRYDFIGEPSDPAALLVPYPTISQAETMQVVTRLAESVKNVKHIEWDLRAGTCFEGQEADVEEEMERFGGRDQMDRFERAMKKWKTMDTFMFAVEDASQRQQVLATPTWTSPLLTAMIEWDNLTILDFWRVKIVLPASASSASLQPRFRLREITFSQSTLGGVRELEFFLGAPSPSPESRRRSSALDSLILQDNDFLSHPSFEDSPSTCSASEDPHPLLALFRSSPPFLSTLSILNLTIRTPLGPPETTSGLLSGLTAVETVELGGQGVDEGIFSSLFLPATPGEKAPSEGLKQLVLTYLAHPSLALPTLLSYINPTSASSSFPSSLRPTPPLALTNLLFLTSIPLPLSLSTALPYSERRLIPDLVWEPLSSWGPTRDEEGEEEAWDAIIRAARGVNREKKRRAHEKEEGAKWERVRVWKNRFEVPYDPLNSPPSSGEEEEGDEAEISDAASSLELNALFVPDEEELEEIRREGGAEWMERVREAVRREEEEEEEEEGF